jgi:hypothetical protein
MSNSPPPLPHPELHALRSRLDEIYTSIVNFEPFPLKPPVLDSSVSVDVTGDASEDSPWLRRENIPGLRNLRDSVKRDLDILEKVNNSLSITRLSDDSYFAS